MNSTALLENFTTGVLVTDEHVLDGDLIPKKVWTQHFVRVYVPASLATQQEPPVVYFSIQAWNFKNVSSNSSNIAVADFRIPQKPCSLPDPWPHNLISRARPTATSSTMPTKNVPAGTADDSGPALPKPASPSPPAQREISSVTAVSVGIFFLLMLLFLLAAGVWYRYNFVTLGHENEDERPLQDLEKAVEPGTQG